jgi:ferredoxin
MLYIDPDHCIDCEACVPECPIEAIFHEASVPPQWRQYIALNAERARLHPVVTEKKEQTPRPSRRAVRKVGHLGLPSTNDPQRGRFRVNAARGLPVSYAQRDRFKYLSVV